MSRLYIAHQIEQLMINYVRTFAQVRGLDFELAFNEAGVYDIVVQLSEDEELVLGQVCLEDDLCLYVEFFNEDETLNDWY